MKTTGDDTRRSRTVLQTRRWRRPTPHLLSVGQPEPPYDETPRVGKAHAPPNISTGTTRRDGRQVDEQISSGEATPPEHALRIVEICCRSKNENRPPTDPNPKIRPLPPATATPTSHLHQEIKTAVGFSLGSSTDEARDPGTDTYRRQPEEVIRAKEKRKIRGEEPSGNVKRTAVPEAN